MADQLMKDNVFYIVTKNWKIQNTDYLSTKKRNIDMKRNG